MMDEEKAFPKRYRKFEVYYLPMLSFYFKAGNLSMFALYFSNFNKCFGALELVQKFYMYSYYRALYYRSHSKDQSYYVELLKDLENDESIRLGVLVEKL